MTNKEAINILKDMIDYQWGFSDMEKSIGIDALKKGIEALENQKSIIKELEKIKTEIRKLTDINPDYPMDKTIHISRYEVQKIIYERIAELKGEVE